ncbi:pseudouridine-metabolizing bifunctional protein C1861.05-like [Actinia tenebrosa]|uniref:Pseudouridine-metabolizing bifunctional protein C1861.05-like n=1 Tax=Actinia tenebrosa TaxID=6105 RepID=A0A6P8I711_ACTTE|nr:pseudouridine-metabolizing bifunctional protein C1861.05-like [Actinia tenebrosa]
MMIKGVWSVLKHSRLASFRRLSTITEYSPLGTGLGPKPIVKTLLDKTSNPLLNIYPEVADAVALKKPVVALESTIITHGFAYPQNLSIAKEVCKIVRENGAIPATVAVFDGCVHVGISMENLEKLAKNKESVKTSRRDFPYVLSKGMMGGTTVAGTMIAAEKAGIDVFVTGGIGGVHRGAQTTFDVSADLTELGRTPVAVVCAGAKSILDIQLTLEYLETQGVTVATYGNTKDFPSFFTSKSGFESSCFVQTPIEAAKLIDCSKSFGLQKGMVIAVPIPEEEAGEGSLIEQAIQQALNEASSTGIIGKDITPFVLKRLNELTEGKSVQANFSLVKNNARVGSQIAVELSKLRQGRKSMSPATTQGSVSLPTDGQLHFKNDVTKPSKRVSNDETNGSERRGRPVVIGGSNVDFIATAKTIIPEASNPGKVRMSFGGVGRNIAEALSRLKMKPLFISAVGEDPLGAMLLDHCREVNISTGGIQTFSTCQTGTYSTILSNEGDFNVAVGDMDIHQKLTPHLILSFEESIKNAPLVIVDANSKEESLDFVIQLCTQHKVPVWFEPTCMMKSALPFQSSAWQNITYASPNVHELRSMSDTVVQYHKAPRHRKAEKLRNREKSLEDAIEECILLSQPLMTHIHCLVITLGKNGVLVCRNTAADHRFPTAQFSEMLTMYHELVSVVHFPVPEVKDIVNVTGAGDSLAAAIIMAIIRGYQPEICIKLGLKAAIHSLHSQDAVSQSLTPDNFTADLVKDWTELTHREIDIRDLL